MFVDSNTGRLAWMALVAMSVHTHLASAYQPSESELQQVAYCSDQPDSSCYLERCGDGFAYGSGYADGCCDLGTACGDACCLPPWAHRTGMWGQFLYLHPVDADVSHAQQQNGTGGAGTTPFGLIGITDPDAEPGFRIGGQIACGLCSSVAVNYTFIESSAIDRLEPPTDVGGGLGTVGSLVHHPAAVDAGTGPIITGSAGPVDATYDIKMQLGDIDYRRLVRASNCGWLNYNVGVRYGRLEQNFAQTGNFGGSAGGVIDTSTEIDFDGYGLRAGLDGERLLGRCSPFSVYGNASVSALFGTFRGDYLMHNATTVSDLAIVRWEDDRSAPMLEYELGLAWTSCSGGCRAKIGYTAIHWFNVVTTDEFIDAAKANNYTDVSGTLSFNGLTSSVEWRY